jgi:hypothetical protein
MSLQQIFAIIIGVLFFLFGLYSLITGKMYSDGTGLTEGGLVVGIKAKIMGFLVMVLGVLVGFVIFII